MKKATLLLALPLLLALSSCAEKEDALLGVWTIPEIGLGTLKDEYEGTLTVSLSDEENGNLCHWNGKHYLLELKLTDQEGAPLETSIHGFSNGNMEGVLSIGEDMYRTGLALLALSGVDVLAFMGSTVGSDPLLSFTKGGAAIHVTPAESISHPWKQTSGSSSSTSSN